MSANTAFSFPLFLIIWNRQQKLNTPHLHLKMADWLQDALKTGQKKLLLMAFRSAGKSTLVGLFCAWMLLRDPNIRILVAAADLLLSKKMVRNVKRIIERHPLTQHLQPTQPDQWASDRFTVTRTLELRDPSMLARGIQANMTGSRADLIICDDVEVPNTADTAEKRTDLRTRLLELDYVLTPGGTQLFVGTPHAFDTIYATEARKDLPDSAPFLLGFAALRVPLIDAEGQSVWPERFSDLEIERLRTHTGPNRFRSQMLLSPVNISEGRLNWQAVRRYDSELIFVPELRTLQLGENAILSASAWWDPAFGHAKGDRSVFAAIYVDHAGHRYIHRVVYLSTQAQAKEDEATQQSRTVVELLRDLRLPALAIETNGIGRFLPSILRRELLRANVPASVIEKTSRQSKEIRILEAFDAPLAAQILHAHTSVFQTPFLNEMREWRPGASLHDDGLDAVAGALSLEPIRFAGGRLPGGPTWKRGADTSHAKTDFTV